MAKVLYVLGALFILLNLLLAVAALSPFTKNPNSGLATMVQGDKTKLACRTKESTGQAAVTWHKQGKDGVLKTGRRLQFDPVVLDDAGNYSCDLHTAEENVGYFHVTVIPSYWTYGFVGDRIGLKNTQTGRIEDIAIFSWYNYAKPNGQQGDDSRKVFSASFGGLIPTPGYSLNNKTYDLIILNAALSHEGMYAFLTNTFETPFVLSYNKLFVYVKPSHVRMAQFPLHAIESHSYPISCFVARVKPVNVTFTWMLASNVESSATHEVNNIEHTDGTFRVTSTLNKSFRRRDDGLALKCQVTHGVDTSLTSYAESTVQVYYKYETKAVLADVARKPVVGNSTALSCKVVLEGKPTSDDFKWYKDNIEMKDTDDGKLSDTTTSTLLISRLTTADNGPYICRIQNDAGPGNQAGNYTIDVLSFPSVSISGAQTVSEGAAVTLECSVDAKPPVKSAGIEWFLNGVPLHNNQLTYQVSPAQRTDDGLYRCTATNEIGTRSATHNLDVQFAPTGQPSLEADVGVMRVGTEQRLTCNTDPLQDMGNPKSTHFTWLYNGQPMAATEASTQLKPMLVTNSGDYTCAVVNVIGKSTNSKPVFIAVQAPINIVDGSAIDQHEPSFDDSSFSIGYTVSGGQNVSGSLSRTPGVMANTDFINKTEKVSGTFQYGQDTANRFSFTWQTADKQLKTCEKVLYFNGFYTFNATGTVAGTPSYKTTTFKIKVKYPAMWNSSPKVISSAMEIDKILVCDVCANPTPNPTQYEWHYKKGTLPASTTPVGASLHITSVSLEHFGDYQCAVSNIINGSTETRMFSIELIEKGSPHKPINFDTASRTAETLSIQWTVTSNGGFKLAAFDLEYRKLRSEDANNSDKWQKRDVSIAECQTEHTVCNTRILNLGIKTKYSLRIRAKNERPEERPTDPYSAYQTLEAETKDIPQIEFHKTRITDTTLTVSWTYNTASAQRRKRDTAADDDLTLEILYKRTTEYKFKRFPTDQNSKPSLTKSHEAVITGKFEVTKAYDVQVYVYEGVYMISKSYSASTHEGGVATPPTILALVGIIAGAVIGVLVVIVIVVISCYRCGNRRKHGPKLELPRKAISNEQLVNKRVGQSYQQQAQSGQFPETDSLALNEPRLPSNGHNERTIASFSSDESTYMNVTKTGVNQHPQNEGIHYENVPKTEQYQNVSFQPGDQSLGPSEGDMVYDDVTNNHGDGKADNACVYTDVAFKENSKVPQRTKGPGYIHGSDDRTDYACLDYKKMAETPSQCTESNL